MSAVRSSKAVAPPRKLSYACENCRARKRRCDGQKPKCGLCTLTDHDCQYRGRVLNPSTGSFQLTASRVTSRRYLDDLESRYRRLRSIVSQLQRASTLERDRILDDLELATIDHAHKDALVDLSSNEPTPAENQNSQSRDLGSARERSRIEKDKNETIHLHGPSSLFYLASQSTEHEGDRNLTQEVGHVENIEEQMLAGWIDSLEKSPAIPIVSNVVCMYLLRMHWIWIQPLFGFVHRAAFLRDMHRPRSPKSLCSPFLLYALCTHVLRRNDLALLGDDKDSPEQPSMFDPFLRQALIMVYKEVEKGSSLSCIQGCLLLSAKECAIGRMSQAWIHLGIAVRMLQDLGIHMDGERSDDRDNLSQEELESRRHSFWSAYLWDKMISLYMGRTPMLQLSTYSPPEPASDAQSEHELWSPSGNRLEEFPIFMPVPALAASTFTHFCKLARIINAILLYDSADKNPSDLEVARVELAKWREQLPSDLKLNAAAGLTTIPPPHVINLNCIYHMTSILLGRRVSPASLLSTSLSSALEICVLAQISQKQFQDRQAVISHCYCIYTASTTFLARLKARDHQPWLSNEESIVVTSLRWCMERLQGASLTNEALARPLRVLNDHLAALQPHLPGAELYWFTHQYADNDSNNRNQKAPHQQSVETERTTEPPFDLDVASILNEAPTEAFLNSQSFWDISGQDIWESFT